MFDIPSTKALYLLYKYWAVAFLLGFYLEHGCMGLWSRNYILVSVSSLGDSRPAQWGGTRGACWHNTTLWGTVTIEYMEIILSEIFIVILYSFLRMYWLCVSFHKQIDLRKESRIQFVAPSSYPVITFGPFPSPTAVLIALSHAVGNFLIHLSYYFFSPLYV